MAGRWVMCGGECGGIRDGMGGRRAGRKYEEENKEKELKATVIDTSEVVVVQV